MKTPYWQWSRLVPAHHLDAWEERLCSLPGTSLATTLLPGGRSARLHLFSSSPHPLRRVVLHFGGSLQRRSLSQDLAEGSSEFRLRIGRRLVVSSSPPSSENSAVPHLWIPAGIAFGSGQHATTALCLRRLAEQIPPGTSGTLLDVGTGSGLLALAADRLGWRALGFDHDPSAIREAQNNAARNRLRHRVRFKVADLATFSPNTLFDLVVANLYASLHELFLARMASWLKPDGRLILSGILLDQEDNIASAASAAGHAVVQRWRRGKWLCLITAANQENSNQPSQ